MTGIRFAEPCFFITICAADKGGGMDVNMETARKIYVAVKARFAPDGKLMPLALEWEDGIEFIIDEVTDVRRAASLKAGGAGVRYTVRIKGRERYLFLEEDKWFIEGRYK